jgi:DNA invertase Pin-like site-specific DNA recombinase
MANYGYARVSTDEQDNAAQIAALKAAGCDPIIPDTGSGGQRRVKLDKLLASLKEGDVLMVWKLDRLSRSLRDVVLIMEEIAKSGAKFKSLTEPMFDTTANGRLMLQIVAAFAEFERGVLRERTRAGMKAAKARGKHCGRRSSLNFDQQFQLKQMLAGGMSQADAARAFNVHRSTILRFSQKHALAVEGI